MTTKKYSTQFPGYSAQNLLEISSGLASFFGILVTNKNGYYLTDDDTHNFSWVAILQEDIIREVISRIPDDYLEMMPDKENENGKRSG